jgi:hypothetical protein
VALAGARFEAPARVEGDVPDCFDSLVPMDVAQAHRRTRNPCPGRGVPWRTLALFALGQTSAE